MRAVATTPVDDYPQPSYPLRAPSVSLRALPASCCQETAYDQDRLPLRLRPHFAVQVQHNPPATTLLHLDLVAERRNSLSDQSIPAPQPFGVSLQLLSARPRQRRRRQNSPRALGQLMVNRLQVHVSELVGVNAEPLLVGV